MVVSSPSFSQNSSAQLPSGAEPVISASVIWAIIIAICESKLTHNHPCLLNVNFSHCHRCIRRNFLVCCILYGRAGRGDTYWYTRALLHSIIISRPYSGRGDAARDACHSRFPVSLRRLSGHPTLSGSREPPTTQVFYGASPAPSPILDAVVA